MGLSQHNGRGEAAERLSYLQIEVNNESSLTNRVSISTCIKKLNVITEHFTCPQF